MDFLNYNAEQLESPHFDMLFLLLLFYKPACAVDMVQNSFYLVFSTEHCCLVAFKQHWLIQMLLCRLHTLSFLMRSQVRLSSGQSYMMHHYFWTG